MKEEVLRTEKLFQGLVFDIRRDEVRLPGGDRAVREVVEHGGAVTIAPVGEDGRVWFVRQYRHPAGKVLLELPAGTLEAGEPPEDCARRECREEVGLSPGALTPLGGCYLAPGYSTEFMTFFLARELSPAPLETDPDEALQAQALSIEEVKNLLRRNEVEDAKTLVGLFLAFGHLGWLDELG